MKARPNDQDRLIEEARTHLGYKPRPGGISFYAEKVGYASHGSPWDGAFIDVVARDANCVIPSCTSTSSGLAEFIYSGRWRKTPRPGDIVFYSFSTGGPWGQPHVGIVTGVDRWKIDGTFIALEAMVDSGLPQGSKEMTGVFERVRWKNEVLGFCRPNFKLRPELGKNNMTGAKNTLKLSHLKPRKKHESVKVLQQALKITSGLVYYEAGHYDNMTQNAFARWQRQIGYVGEDANGIPNHASLSRLGSQTGLFQTAAEN